MRPISELIESYDSRKKEIAYPYIIAEAGVNHEGDLEIAKRLINEAAEGGANAIKFQTYKASTLASKNSPSYWDLSKEETTSQFELFQKYDKFWKNEYEKLKIHCDEVGIEFMSTPFDTESAIFLNDLMDVYKISSSDLSNFPFIEEICRFGKPIILSTGASYLWEVYEVVDLINSHGNDLCLMHCVLNYPTPDQNANLGFIKDLRLHFPNIMTGYSDHTLPKSMETIKIAAILGAEIIEKHFTHDKKLPGNDHYHAMDKEDLKHFHEKMKEAMILLGSCEKTVLEEEDISRINARRSIVAATDISRGQKLTESMLTWKRPGSGISPKDLHKIIGRTALQDIKQDDLINWSQISN